MLWKGIAIGALAVLWLDVMIILYLAAMAPKWPQDYGDRMSRRDIERLKRGEGAE